MAEACRNTMNWFALTVKPQHERAAAEQLASKSLDSYVPLYRSRRWWSDRVKIVELPLFPRYVFCRFSFAERLQVLSTPSVTSIVTFEGKPCPVSDIEIDYVKRIVGSNFPIFPWPLLHVGQRVRICKGALAGVEGILTREKAAYWVVVSVEIMQRAIAVEIERDLLEPIVSDGGALRTQAAASLASRDPYLLQPY